jgi:xylan 1,4-beta-xylosidase
MNISEKAGANHYFWKAAGHDHMFSMTEDKAGDYIFGRIKEYNTVKYIRTHFTFTTHPRHGGNVVVYDNDTVYHYDFSRLNRVFRYYLDHGVKPIVEFDFFPKGFSVPFGDGLNSEGFNSRHAEPRDWNEWENLIKAFMDNLISTFGKEELRTWYYEVWNEPDGWPTENLPVFYRLYDVFSHTVKSYDEGFRVGGPAVFRLYALKPFLDHVSSGTNFVTGAKGSPIDFISFHIYGLSGSWLNSAPEMTPQVGRFSQELLWAQRLINQYEGFDKKEFHLNEWGLCSHFEKSSKNFPKLNYRNTEFSPLFMTKLVDCIYAVEDNYRFKTSLMLYWGFSLEDRNNEMFAGHRDLTTGGHTPKPMMTGFEFLSMLQPERLKVKGNLPGERLGIIPTISEKSLAFIVYNFNETDDDLSIKDLIQIQIEGLKPSAKFNYKVYTLDRDHNNNYTKWLKSGAPAKPESLSESWFREANTLEFAEKSASSGKTGTLSFKVKLPRHSMQLFIVEM